MFLKSIPFGYSILYVFNSSSLRLRRINNITKYFWELIYACECEWNQIWEIFLFPPSPINWEFDLHRSKGHIFILFSFLGYTPNPKSALVPSSEEGISIKILMIPSHEPLAPRSDCYWYSLPGCPWGYLSLKRWIYNSAFQKLWI